MKLQYILLIFSFLFLKSFIISAQIDEEEISASDSTQTADSLNAEIKMNYGAKTTIHFYEQEILEHQYDTNFTDTLLHNLHRYNFLQKNGNRYQNLGGMGTATTPIYYEFPKQIGTQLGYNSFEPYVLQPSKMKYFNTMSPYTEIDFAQGGSGRTHLKVVFSQNINPDLNFAVRYQKMQQNEVFVNSVRQNTTWASNEVFAGNLSWWSRNHRYKLLTNITHYEHITNDFGGYQLSDTTENLNELFEVENNAQLAFNIDQDVSALQTRKQWHLYHQYALFDSSTVQIFHVMNRTSQINRQRDGNFRIHNLYDTVQFELDSLNSDIIDYQQNYTFFENKAGVKGQISRVYYQVYTRLKQYELSTQYVHHKVSADTSKIDSIEDDIFIGGMFRFDFSDSSKLTAKTEYLTNKNNDYQLDIRFKNKLVDFRYQNSSYSPSILQNRFYGGFFRWGDTLAITKNTTTQRYSGALNLNFSSASIRPFVSYTSLQNYVYFDSLAQPKQFEENIKIIQFVLNTNFAWRKLKTELEFLYTTNNQENIIRMPKYQISGKIYRHGKLFRSQRMTQLGVDFHYKSAYYADSFMPATQQFYLQNKFKVENYLNVDLFFSFQIKSFLLFTKISNLTQGLIGKGYYTTPVYFAQSRGFEVGLKWRFFD